MGTHAMAKTAAFVTVLSCSSAHAQTFTASHQQLSIEQAESGEKHTYKLTINNDSGEHYSAVVLYPAPPLTGPVIPIDSIQVDAIAAGGTVSTEWSVTFLKFAEHPAIVVAPFSGSATRADGTTVNVDFESFMGPL